MNVCVYNHKHMQSAITLDLAGVNPKMLSMNSSTSCASWFLKYSEATQSNTSPGAWRLIHLTIHQGHL